MDWTDDRLDALSARMDERFDRVDERFEQVDDRFERVETEIRDLRVEMGQGFSALNLRFDAMQRALFLAAAGVIAALLGLIATQL